MNKYLTTVSILLVSSKPTHRSGIRKILCDLGANNNKIEVASNFEQAEEKLEKGKINIIVCDEDISEGPKFLELLPLHAANNPVSKSRMFLLMAGDMSPLLESEFLLSGGDALIKKPFTNSTFTSSFMTAVKHKENLSSDEARTCDLLDALKVSNVDQAKKLCSEFKNPDTHEGYYCLGMINKYDSEFNEAFTNFQKSVQKDPDLKSLVEVVSVGIKSKKYAELGSVAERWIKSFPLHRGSIPNLTRIVLYNKNFDLLNEMKIDDEMARAPLAAGLIVASSFYLARGDWERTIEYANKGIEFSCLKPMILKRGIEILILAGAKAEAEKVFQGLSQRPVLSENKEFMLSLESMLKAA